MKDIKKHPKLDGYLKFKMLRTTALKGTVLVERPKTFDPIKWATCANNQYGPNLYVDKDGSITEIIPLTHYGNVFGADREKAIIMVDDSDEAKKVGEALQSKLIERFKEEVDKQKKPDEAAKPHHTERSEVSSKKDKKN